MKSGNRRFLVWLHDGGHVIMVVDPTLKRAKERVEKMTGSKSKWMTHEEIGKRNLIIQMEIVNTDDLGFHKFEEA
jgi:hypothetical protein